VASLSSDVVSLSSDVASLSSDATFLGIDMSISARPRGIPARLAFSIGFSNGFARFPAGGPGAAVQRLRRGHARALLPATRPRTRTKHTGS